MIVTILCAVAGVVTPLGLYDTLQPEGKQTATFTYVRDNSPFGITTPPRSNLSFSRICSNGVGLFQGPAPCPYSNTQVVFSWNGSAYEWDLPYGYNTTIPTTLRNIFTSGTLGATTISSYFDIEWRRYNFQHDKVKNNGSTLLVGDYRPITSLILENSRIAIEGLVVDSENGGIGFRNHTLPTGFKHGASWNEDLLFVEPESRCVPNNLSIEFIMRTNSSYSFTNISLVDEGGFFELNSTYPLYDHDNAQNDPDLRGRAYKAAWLNNAYSMAFFNVTSVNDNRTGHKAFDYLNSYSGKRFLLTPSSYTNYASLLVSNYFGFYIPSTGRYPNPWGISSTDWSNTGMLQVRRLVLIFY